MNLPDPNILPNPEPCDVDLAGLVRTLTKTLHKLEIPASVVQAIPGPSTVSFELEPFEGVHMRDFTRLEREKDISYALEAQTVRVQAPIPGKHRVGVEIPSPSRRAVALSEVVPWCATPLRCGLGVTPSLSPLTLDIASLPHLSIAGSSGSGKSSLLHSIICSLLMQATPEELQLVLVDVKRVELTQYRGIPHLGMFAPVVDSLAAIEALEDLVGVVEDRYRFLEAQGARDIGSYNGRASERMPYILCVVDELADLMMTGSKRVEAAVVRLGQLGRACGVHLILATQSPHAKILSGLIKANLPARIALRVASGTHSRVAIDQGGAETLLGSGDALLQDGCSVGLQRFQGAYVPSEVLSRIVGHWRMQVVESDPRVSIEYAPVEA